MLKELHSAAEGLVEELCQKVENSEIRRLENKGFQGAKVILPRGFEHITAPTRAYLVWPSWFGSFNGYDTTVEFIPRSSDYCRICFDIHKTDLQYNFWIFSEDGEPSIFETSGAVLYALEDEELGKLYRCLNLGPLCEIINSEAFCRILKQLPEFLRLRVHGKGVRLTWEIDDAVHINAEHILKYLTLLSEMTKALEQYEDGDRRTEEA
ncbi:hypothetical protein IJT93_09345 [bacterium]|nr:hypothetical protein [bacterium]